MVTLILLFYIRQCVKRACLIKFVDAYNVRIVKHVYFFKLGWRTIFRCHYIHAHITVIKNGSVALPHTSTFKNNKVIAGSFAYSDGFAYILAEGLVTFTGCQATHICRW